jgi:hypothetical protein
VGWVRRISTISLFAAISHKVFCLIFGIDVIFLRLIGIRGEVYSIDGLTI